MENSNQTYLVLVTGTNGVGKSTFVAETIKEYLYDYDDEYKVILIDPQKSFPLNKNSKRIIKPAINIKNKTLENVKYETYFNKIYNSLIVIDDARILFSDWQGRDLVDLAINRRHHNNDIIIIYHSLGEVQKTLFSVSSFIYLFKVNENWDRVKSNVPPQITENLYNRAVNLNRGEKFRIALNP